MSPANQQYPCMFYHQDGRKPLRVDSPDREPKGEGWRKNQPWPGKPPLPSDDVHSMPPDQAIAHLKDQVSDLQSQVRNLKAEKDWQVNQFNRKWETQSSELAEAKAKIAESATLLANSQAAQEAAAQSYAIDVHAAKGRIAELDGQLGAAHQRIADMEAPKKSKS